MSYCPHCGAYINNWTPQGPWYPYTPYTPYPTYPSWFTTTGTDKTPPIYGDSNATQGKPSR